MAPERGTSWVKVSAIMNVIRVAIDRQDKVLATDLRLESMLFTESLLGLDIDSLQISGVDPAFPPTFTRSEPPSFSFLLPIVNRNCTRLATQ